MLPTVLIFFYFTPDPPTCQTDAPYGGFILGVYAKQITSRVLPGEACGALAFRYTLDFNSANSTENELNILFKEVKPHVPL